MACCTITYADRTAHTTAGESLFEAVANTIEWIEVDRRSFGTARRIPDAEIFTVYVVGGGIYRVCAGRVHEWPRDRLTIGQ